MYRDSDILDKAVAILIKEQVINFEMDLMKDLGVKVIGIEKPTSGYIFIQICFFVPYALITAYIF